MYLFFDFDDTVSDSQSFQTQYVSALSRILSREMGGKVEDWSAAIAPSLATMIQRYLNAFQRNPLAGYNRWLREERSRVVADTFSRAGRPAPDPESSRDLAVHLQQSALRECSALFPGADAGLRALAERGFKVHFASSQESPYLRAAMTGSPAYFIVKEWYGPDLVDCAKEGPEFYRRIFEDCGIPAEQAVVVDDQMMCLEWAYEVGAKVIQSRIREQPDPIGADIYFESWSELPPIIETLMGAGKLTEDVGLKE